MFFRLKRCPCFSGSGISLLSEVRGFLLIFFYWFLLLFRLAG